MADSARTVSNSVRRAERRLIMSRRTISVRIEDLQMNLFVRWQLNEEHALYLAELIENGVLLPPIKITPDMVVIDGRHRIEAHILLNRTISGQRSWKSKTRQS
jgi:hypothetical protein